MSLLALVMRNKYVSPAWAIFNVLRPAVRCFSGTASTEAARLGARYGVAVAVIAVLAVPAVPAVPACDAARGRVQCRGATAQHFQL